MEPLELELVKVCHRYPGLDLDTPGPIDAKVPASARALVLGPNGAGKSTLLQRIVGLLHGPGLIRVGGLAVEPNSARRIRKMVGLAWQNPEDGLLLPTALEDVAFGAVNDGMPSSEARERALQWLARLGAVSLAHRPVQQLSMGEKQLVALAGLLIREPGLLLLDEPTAYLDAAARERVMKVLAELATTQVVVTHDPQQWKGDVLVIACGPSS